LNRESTNKEQGGVTPSDLTTRVVQGLVYGLIIGVVAAAVILGTLIALQKAW